ncbi:MAG: MBL fold metallo-hydrolase [Bryobacteraceae bacterium]|jgi:beta-lactamase superfamily II metal-dependent hydrolase
MKIAVAAWLMTLIAGFAAAAGKLEVYVIDVEGGKSVLIISPGGQTMLIDAGWPASPNREASVDRIVAMAQAAGVKQIDDLVISHFDVDHMGDVPQLASKLPVRRVFDHSEFQSNPKLDDAQYKAMIQGEEERFRAYDKLRKKVGHTVVKPGDTIPLKGAEVQVLSAGGKLSRNRWPVEERPITSARSIRSRPGLSGMWKTICPSGCFLLMGNSACWTWRIWKLM